MTEETAGGSGARPSLLPLFTEVRGIGFLGSSLAGSWIKPRNTPPMALIMRYPRSGRSVLSEVGCLCKFVDCPAEHLTHQGALRGSVAEGTLKRRDFPFEGGASATNSAYIGWHKGRFNHQSHDVILWQGLRQLLQRSYVAL